MRILNVVGARPNFMKIAPLMQAWRAHPQVEPLLLHTGQHYDHSMSDLFFEELGIPRPDINLEVRGGSHAYQHAEVIRAFEPVCQQLKPDLLVVVGDVNSTVSCALVAAKLGVRVAHVEAGLRSFERTMPEEINRILTDQIADLLFVSEESGLINLAREGLDHEGVHFVGNVMIDSLLRHLPRAEQSPVLEDLGLTAGTYGVLTLHRPANVDDPAVLGRLLEVLARVHAEVPLVFPAHPRTLDRLEKFGLRAKLDAFKGLRIVEPMGYFDFLKLVGKSRIILTDSGGIQEETTVLRVPCVTLRETTERPSTCIVGTNRLAGTDPARIWADFEVAMATDPKAYGIPAKWDGKAAERIAAIIAAEGPLPRTPFLQATRHGALARISRVE
ncbi:MAG: UDP-N-acetylglucosamine 2-epimerase (non-hydrolyzing) [bacterium]